MSAVPLTQKLVVLCLLNACKHPLTSEQIDVYMVENHWSDYMLVQQLKCELQEAQFVTVTDTPLHFTMLTPRGRDSLRLFVNRIPPYLRRQVDVFVQNNAERILRESTIFTDVQPQNSGSSYRAQVRLYEGQNLALSVKITVPDEATARSFQRRFASRGSALREDIMALCYSIPDEGAALANEEDG